MLKVPLTHQGGQQQYYNRLPQGETTGQRLAGPRLHCIRAEGGPQGREREEQLQALLSPGGALLRASNRVAAKCGRVSRAHGDLIRQGRESLSLGRGQILQENAIGKHLSPSHAWKRSFLKSTLGRDLRSELRIQTTPAATSVEEGGTARLVRRSTAPLA